MSASCPVDRHCARLEYYLSSGRLPKDWIEIDPIGKGTCASTGEVDALINTHSRYSFSLRHTSRHPDTPRAKGHGGRDKAGARGDTAVEAKQERMGVVPRLK